MSLVVKFNLVFAAVFALGLAGAGYMARSILYGNARDETLENARLIMEAAIASRTYTATQVAPLLAKQLDTDFPAASVPAFAATEQFNELHVKYPDFSYKEATLNPTNPRDRATDWEADIVNRFRQYHQAETHGERETPSGRSLYLARPIQIHDAACLECHSTVEAAPKAMIRRYGTANGFGWKLNEIVGAQIVSVPMAFPERRAERALRGFVGAFAAIFLAAFALLNAMLMVLVVRPVTRLAKAADEVSLGKIDAPEFPASGRDELSMLAQSFNRMKKSLAHAIKLLEQ